MSSDKLNGKKRGTKPPLGKDLRGNTSAKRSGGCKSFYPNNFHVLQIKEDGEIHMHILSMKENENVCTCNICMSLFENEYQPQGSKLQLYTDNF